MYLLNVSLTIHLIRSGIYIIVFALCFISCLVLLVNEILILILNPIRNI